MMLQVLRCHAKLQILQTQSILLQSSFVNLFVNPLDLDFS